MKKITTDNYIKNFFEQRYRDFVLKPALKIVNKHQAKSELMFWTMPFDTICKNIILNRFYEIELLNGMHDLVKNNAGVAIDIGANIGNHSLFFAEKFKRVIAFEPVPSNCWILKSNTYLNKIDNLTLIQKGLSNKKSKMAIDTSNRRNTNNGIAEINENSKNQIVVDIEIGDEEIEKLNLGERIVLIKIDVEGHEPFVVEGLKKTIEKNRPLIFWEAFSRNEANRTKILLEQMGYSNFYHLTPNRFSNKLINKLWKSVSKATYLTKMDECKKFDGMNVASAIEL